MVIRGCQLLSLQVPVIGEVQTEREFSLFARMTLGFSVPELATLRLLIDREFCATPDPLPASRVIDDVIEIVSRQCWRLEQQHPNMFGPGSIAVVPTATTPAST